MGRSAIRSRWAVETPGRSSDSTSARTSATRRPARRIFSISARDFRLTNPSAIEPLETREQVRRHCLDRPSPVDGMEHAGGPIVLDDLLEGSELAREARPDRLLAVVVALDER